MSRETTELVKIRMNAPVANGTNVQALLEQYRHAFEITAAKNLDVNRVMRIALMSISRNRALLECTASSLLGAFMLSVQLGLDIGAKECYLVPFKNKDSQQKEVQLIPDYRGLAKLVRNTGAVINIKPMIVYEQDYFEYEEGMSPKLIHRPSRSHEFKDDDIIGAYTIATFKEGYVEAHFISRHYINKVRGMSKAQGANDPWAKHFDEMAKKTCIKHHCKNLPQSIELMTAIDLDNRAENAKPQSIDVLQDRISGKTIAEMPPEDEPEGIPERSSSATDLTQQQPAATKLDQVVKTARARTQRTAEPPKSEREIAAEKFTEAAPNSGQGDPDAAPSNVDAGSPDAAAASQRRDKSKSMLWSLRTIGFIHSSICMLAQNILMKLHWYTRSSI
jgi:recombination protein RecT